MIKDLIGAGKVQATADCLIIGAGTVGLVVATRLAALGKRVICMESGGREQAEDTHPLNETEQEGTRYAGAEHGRFRCLGGTSTRWGGALIPFQAEDLNDANWPIRWTDLEPYLPAVEALFGLQTGSYYEPLVSLSSDYVARLAKWPSFGKRNVYSLLKRKIDADDGPEVWINATATGFEVLAGKLESVRAESCEGSTLKVTASEVVICAGAIESTRLLLLLQQQNPSALTGAKLGQGLHDHLSAVVGEIEVSDRKALNRLVGLRFSPGGGMRNLRFELAPACLLRQEIPPSFVHIGFSETQGGFSALRDVFRSLQKRKLPPTESLGRLISESPWLARAIFWRLVYKRLLIPDGARIQVHMVIEQASSLNNKVVLSTRNRDFFQKPIARIEWSVLPQDAASMVRAVEAFCASWAQSSLSRLGLVRQRSEDEITKDMSSGGGIYHPGGTTRFANDAADGVVNTDLRVFGVKNLAVLATSVLPTGGGANPTMMLLLLAERYAEAYGSQ